MNWKCIITGHTLGDFEIIDEASGIYQRTCSNCLKTFQKSNTNITRMLATNKRDSMHRLAWITLSSMFPDTFYKEPGKTKHMLSYHSNGDVSFSLDLTAEQMEQFRQSMYEADLGYKSWRFQPLLKLIKD